MLILEHQQLSDTIVLVRVPKDGVVEPIYDPHIILHELQTVSLGACL